MIAVIDTNVIVSAFLTPEGSPAKIIDMLLDNVFTAAINKDVLNEYEIVLKRPKLKLDAKDISAFLEYVRQFALSAASDAEIDNGLKIHKDDRKFIEAAVSCAADYIVTGNLKHFPAYRYKNCKILSPADFLLLLR
jgi:uncharacterized protein